MDKVGNPTSVDTYDSDFSIGEMEEQTKRHFEEHDKLMSRDDKAWIYTFFYALNKDELYNILQEFYETAYGDGERQEPDFEDSIKWTLADHEEIEERL